jgi:hypothetical protein
VIARIRAVAEDREVQANTFAVLLVSACIAATVHGGGVDNVERFVLLGFAVAGIVLFVRPRVVP